MIVLLSIACCLSACSSDKQAQQTVDNSAQEDRSVPAKPLTLNELLKNRISSTLAIPLDIEIEKQHRAGNWVLVYGKPVQDGRKAVDYTKSAYAQQAAEGLMEDYFCALVLFQHDKPEIKELVVGDTDTAILDWIEKHGIPESILD